jgi:hypothetical protein
LDESAIIPERDASGRVWNRWNDSNEGDTPPRSSRWARRCPCPTGSSSISSTPDSLAAK